MDFIQFPLCNNNIASTVAHGIAPKSGFSLQSEYISLFHLKIENSRKIVMISHVQC